MACTVHSVEIILQKPTLRPVEYTSIHKICTKFPSTCFGTL